MLLLHGFPSTSAMWARVMPALAEMGGGVRLIAFDQRGYSAGARPEPVEEYGRSQLVGDVVAVAEALGADRFDVVGHDWGGAVAWGVAAAQPARVRSVTSLSVPHPDALVEAMGLPSGQQAEMSGYMALFGSEPGKAEDVLLDPAGGGLEGQFERWGMDRTNEENWATVKHHISVLAQPGALTGALNWYRRGFEWVGVGRIEVPALYIWPTEDAALGREAAELTQKYVDGVYRFVEVPGTSHWVVEEQPDLVVEEISAHLAST